jgi:hypothetical protein
VATRKSIRRSARARVRFVGETPAPVKITPYSYGGAVVRVLVAVAQKAAEPGLKID